MENPAIPSAPQTAAVPVESNGDNAHAPKGAPDPVPVNTNPPNAQEATNAPVPPAPVAPPSAMTLPDMLANPDVAAKMQIAVAAAVEAERKRVEKEAQLKADRAKMDAAERAEAEKKEAQEQKAEAEKQAAAVRLELDMHHSLTDHEIVLQDKGVRDYLYFQSMAMVNANDGMSMDTAVQKVLEANPWLVKTPAAPAAPALTPEQTAAAETAPRPSTAPVTRTTTTPAVETPGTGVDTLRMTAAEYQLYKQETHRLN